MRLNITNQKLTAEDQRRIIAERSRAAREKVKQDAIAIRNEYKKQVSTAIVTAFGLVIALVWKDVVTALMPSITAPSILQKYPLLANLYTALIITVLAVLGILLISRWGKPKTDK